MNLESENSQAESQNSQSEEYTPHAFPSPTPIPSGRSSCFGNEVMADDFAPTYLREKLATAFLILYIIVGLFFAVLAGIALGTLIAASNYLNCGWSKNIFTILLVVVGLVCVLISAIFTILVCSSPAYNYTEKAQKSTKTFFIASVVLIGASVVLFFSGIVSKTTAEFQGAFMGLVYGLVGLQIAKECVEEKEAKQSSLLVPFKLA